MFILKNLHDHPAVVGLTFNQLGHPGGRRCLRVHSQSGLHIELQFNHGYTVTVSLESSLSNCMPLKPATAAASKMCYKINPGSRISSVFYMDEFPPYRRKKHDLLFPTSFFTNNHNTSFIQDLLYEATLLVISFLGFFL